MVGIESENCDCLLQNVIRILIAGLKQGEESPRALRAKGQPRMNHSMPAVGGFINHTGGSFDSCFLGPGI